MKILVANLGSTSFKYRLFDMTDERQMARGGVERIGSAGESLLRRDRRSATRRPRTFPTMRWRCGQCLAQLTDPKTGCLRDAARDRGDRFQGGPWRAASAGCSGSMPTLLAAMEEMSDVAPAHNPPYIAAMRSVGGEAARTSRWWPPSRPVFTPRSRPLAILPGAREWGDRFHVKRWGFHGASHRYIAMRTAELLGREDAAGHLLPPGRLEQLVCHPARAERGDVDGDESAIGSAPQQSDR